MRRQPQLNGNRRHELLRFATVTARARSRRTNRAAYNIAGGRGRMLPVNDSAASVYQFSWLNGPLVAGTPSVLTEISALYSTHYGTWGPGGSMAAGSNISLSPRRIREWLTSHSMVALARLNGVLVGYAIVVRA